MDSDICIFLLKNKYSIVQKIESIGIENCFVSEITILELTYGAINSDHIEKHKKEVNRMEELYGIVPIYGTKEHFAIEKTRLRKEGNLIPDFDLLIGCSAIANNMIMVTRNTKHLSRIKDLQIENWTDPLHNNFL